MTAVGIPPEHRGEGNPDVLDWCPTCSENVVTLRGGICPWCDTALAVATPEPTIQPIQVETPEVAVPERVAVETWRDEEIVAWLRSEGPKVASEIGEHFSVPRGSYNALVTRLRTKGLIEKTGVERLREGSAVGRPAAEYQAKDPAAVEVEPPANQAPAPAPVVEPEPEPTEVVDPVQEVVDEIHDPESMDQGPMTVHEQLVVRYLGGLIGWVERTAYVRDEGPPGHVFDRIERLLGIQDGAT